MQAGLAAIVGAVMAGGAVLAWHISDRQRHTLPQVEEPVVQAGVAAVLSILRSSAVVVDESADLGEVGEDAVELVMEGLTHGPDFKEPKRTAGRLW